MLRSVEIERLVVCLENLFIEGASLEPTLLERIRLSIQRFPEMAELDEEIRLKVFEKVVNYELSIPRMDVEVSRSMLKDKTNGRYASIYAWFVAENGQENEAGKLFDTINEIIRRITRYAAQLSEKNALAIYQLLRPENAKFVTVMPYLWNGKSKEMLENEQMVEERGREMEE